MMTTENITQALKPTSQGAPFRLLIAACVAGVVLPILLPVLCNALLPAPDAVVAKAFYFDNLGQIIAVVGAGGGVGAVIGSVFKTGGKVVAQLAPGVATDATPNGEGVSLGDAPKDAATKNEGSQISFDQEPLFP